MSVYTAADWSVWRESWHGVSLGGTPSGWATVGFDDSGWDIPHDLGGVIGQEPDHALAPAEAFGSTTLNELHWLARSPEFELTGTPLAALVALVYDDSIEVYVNGNLVHSASGPGSEAATAIATSYFTAGTNVVAVRTLNGYDSGPFGNTWVGGNQTQMALRLTLTAAADFSGELLVGETPLPVQFTDLSALTPTAWLWDFGDGGSSTEQNPLHTYVVAGIYSVSLTATNAGGSDSETKNAYVVVTAPGTTIVDVTQPICYDDYCFNGATYDPGGAPTGGSFVKEIDISPVEAVGYDDKRALQDGKDAADVYLGEREIRIQAAIFGTTRGAMFDELADFGAAYHPVNAFAADETNLGFLPFDFYRPTADIATWPASAYPSGIPLRIYARPRNPIGYDIKRAETGGVNGLGLSILARSVLWARDPRIYLQTAQSLSLSTSTQTVTYRGDYPTFPVVSFTMSAAGSSAMQLVVADTTVKVNLSTLTTGSYQIEYANKRAIKVSDGSLHPEIFDVSFAQNFHTIKSGSTARVSSLTGISAITLDYREAFV